MFICLGISHVYHCVVQVLLSRDEVLQLSGVQCVAEVLIHHSHYNRHCSEQTLLVSTSERLCVERERECL